ncbi:phage antirepressor Ant [Salmonella enterica subsp. enterica serovar Newport]|uniref:Phage antirepressor Ant n=1 Tax=Salmonella enterica I TaxID=59201 RepID=A0A3V2P133_SALET|nr:phage antirepressor Ant [Salmonella enterica subsp. enterica serovar Newport]EDA8242727.1 phage antirepressor Ant [Salmonella enterica subsp. enterica serovar Reading]EDI0784780.1 phage antirepressor Ant [Salmonella enterica subsp. enterica serovar Kasenyi]EDT6458696.1 phage antirepressor Ant [Salmonella enterica subsp. enterica]EHW6507568.1 antA/AntB antirepressor family protein [Salmonella enterica]
MTVQLIPVFSGSISNEATLLCNARDLHEFLEVGKDFSNWIRARLNEYGFVENLDYILFSPNLAKTPGRRRKDYHLTLDTAKELAMVERNEKGRQIRRYFIECEKKLREDTAKTQNPLNVDIIMRVRNGSVTHIEHHKSGSVITTEWAIHLLRKSGWIVMPRDELLNTSLAQLMPENLTHTGTCAR